MPALAPSPTRNFDQDTSATDPRWSAIVTRDLRARDHFVYAVRTTGIYCRAGCKARHPHPRNVEFYATARAAEQAGFRPCKRCNPDRSSRDEEQVQLVERLCRSIESTLEIPELAHLARLANVSQYHVHRVFKAVTGVTPREYAQVCRARRVRAELSRSKTVTEAIYGAGYQSSGRFYEVADQLLGMSPSRYRSRGAGLQIRFAVGECSLGSILVAATERGVCAISLGDDPERLIHEFESRFAEAELLGGDCHFERLVAEVVAGVESPKRGMHLPLDIRGTVFQQRVWQALREIPPGMTVTYSALACQLGVPEATRAVARACATNEIAVAIPCHRVVRLDGSLAGYRWGLERKRALLSREGTTEATE